MNRKQRSSGRHLPLAVFAGALALLLPVGCSSVPEPVWTSVAKVEGTSYVTDGNIAIDMQLVGATPPNLQSASGWFSDSIFKNRSSETPEQFNLEELHPSGSDPAIVVGPGSQQLEEKYVAYLTGTLSSKHRVAFWQLAAMEPVVIVVDGTAVGAMRALN